MKPLLHALGQPWENWKEWEYRTWADGVSIGISNLKVRNATAFSVKVYACTV